MMAPDQHDASAGSLSFSMASDIVELVVLTQDADFLQTLRNEVGGSRRLWHVPTADKVSDLLVSGQVGIVVLDAEAIGESAGIFISQIKRQFPDLVVIVSGKQADEIEVARLITEGTVHRFIHKPMSPARARLFADAAVRKYDEQRRRSLRPDPPPTSRSLKVGLVLLGMLLVTILIVTLAWAMYGRP